MRSLGFKVTSSRWHKLHLESASSGGHQKMMCFTVSNCLKWNLITYKLTWRRGSRYLSWLNLCWVEAAGDLRWNTDWRVKLQFLTLKRLQFRRLTRDNRLAEIGRQNIFPCFLPVVKCWENLLVWLTIQRGTKTLLRFHGKRLKLCPPFHQFARPRLHILTLNCQRDAANPA